MMNKCEVPFIIGGKTRGFKFGTLTIRLIMEMRKIESLHELILEMSNTSNIPFTLDLLYCSAKSYCMSKNIPIDFKPEDVANWMDEIGLDEATAMINKAFTQYTPPKQKVEKKNWWQKTRQRIGQFLTSKRLQLQS